MAFSDTLFMEVQLVTIFLENIWSNLFIKNMLVLGHPTFDNLLRSSCNTEGNILRHSHF